MHSTPKVLKSFFVAHKLKQRMNDENMWLQGRYIYDALMVSFSHFGAGLSGKTSKAEYVDKPFLAQWEETKKTQEMSEEDKAKQTEMFFAKLRIMEANHKAQEKEKQK